MPNTYTELLKTTVGTATSSVTLDLTGISGYTDLIIVSSVQNLTGASTICGRYNGDTGSNYSFTYLIGDGTSAFSGRAANTSFSVHGYANTTQFATNITQINNYSNSTTFKTTLDRRGTVAQFVGATVSTWRNTAAITSIVIFNETGVNFAVGSTFSLYGIANADQGAAKATGGIITEDLQYWYHTFGASGAFIPKQSLTADVLVIAGGGGAGGNAGGGGGAGGVAYYPSQSLTAISYNCTVGAGGTKGTTNTIQATQGVNSTFGALTAAVGGGYGSYTGGGGNGGSGGGSRAGTGTVYSGGSPTSGQGNSGGANNGSAPNYGGGGGGGAGAVGANGTSTSGGNGGIGLSTYSSWGIAAGIGQNVSGTVYFAGGGGGGTYDAGTYGTGGLGGGGNAGTNNVQNAVDGMVNTGGGGGGASGTSPSTNGAAGGSGVVIVRYAK